MNCKQGTAIIIGQMIDLLHRIEADDYRKPLQLFNGSTIGQHFRHILDFYSCLLKGLENERIDYALRERDLRMETEPLYASAALKQINQMVEELSEYIQIHVVADFSSELNEERPVVQSTVGRELMYAYDHAVHHLAMIKIGFKEACPSVPVNHQLGVAPSTLKHWKKDSR